MDKKQAELLTNDLLIADALVRIKVIEKLLISKGILTSAELSEESKNISTSLTKSLLEKVFPGQDVDHILNDLNSSTIKK